MNLQVSQPVKILNTTLTGVVEGAVVDNTTLQIIYRVSYTDANGVGQERYFSPDQIAAA